MSMPRCLAYAMPPRDARKALSSAMAAFIEERHQTR